MDKNVPYFARGAIATKNRAERLRDMSQSATDTAVNDFIKVFDTESQKVAMNGGRRVSIAHVCDNDNIRAEISKRLRDDGLKVDHSYINTQTKTVRFDINW